MDQDQMTLDLSEDVARAVDYAFKEAQQYLTSGIGIAPFTVAVIDDGFEVDDHSGETEDDVYESVKMQLAQDMPEGYALCYDGYVDTSEGRQDAIVVEAANRGDATAYALAMMYTCDNGEYVFDANYGYAGQKPQLYPAGTKPIVSGMAELEKEEQAAAAKESSEGAEAEETAEAVESSEGAETTKDADAAETAEIVKDGAASPLKGGANETSANESPSDNESE